MGPMPSGIAFQEGQKGTLVVKSQLYPDAKCVVIISIADNGGGIPEKVKTQDLSSHFLQPRKWASVPGRALPLPIM